MKLGVSPAATSTPSPPGVFNQRFEALFSRSGALGCALCFTPPLILWFICVQCGAAGSASILIACPIHSTICHISGSCSIASSSPPLLLVWMNVSFLSPWLSDFDTVRFSVSSGCFLFLNLLLFFWLFEEAQCVYLCLHLGQKSPGAIFYRVSFIRAPLSW